jgi:hypothetical protein
MTQEQALAEAVEAVKAAHVDAPGGAPLAPPLDRGALARSREHGRLAACLASLADMDPRKLRIPGQTAFWVNLYNACVLRDALELEVEDFFERPRVKVAAQAWSLDDIAHGLLRGNAPRYDAGAPMKKADPRLAFTPLTFDERTHFALYTAQPLSPRLRVFHGDKLDLELEDATRDYLVTHVKVEDESFRAKLRLPRMFDWYADDFGDERGVLEFVLARLDDAAADLVDRRDGRVKFKYF